MGGPIQIVCGHPQHYRFFFRQPNIRPREPVNRMAKCDTKYWDQLDYSANAVLDFPVGIPGFEQERKFVLIEQRPLVPLVFLQSLTTRSLCFLALPVHIVCPDYKLNLSADELEILGLAGMRQPPIGPALACLTLVHIDEKEITTDLLAPIVIHIPAQRGVQAIQVGSDYSLQHRIDLVEAPVCT
jgi:flagellar assembly factor FliW